MTTTRATTSLSFLTNIGIRDIMSLRLDAKSLNKLIRTCKPIYNKYIGSLNQLGALKILQLINDADWPRIQTMAERNSAMLFSTVKLRPNFQLSPLQLALALYDSYSWQMFFDIIEDNQEHIRLFILQALQQTRHITLEPLFKEYENYIIVGSASDSDESETKLLDDAWALVAAKQRQYIPSHMWKEICREGDNWKSYSTFDSKRFPHPHLTRIHDPKTNTYYQWQSSSTILPSQFFNSKLNAADFSFARGGSAWVDGPPKLLDHAPLTALEAKYDLIMLRKLFATRINELIALREQLATSYPELYAAVQAQLKTGNKANFEPEDIMPEGTVCSRLVSP